MKIKEKYRINKYEFKFKETEMTANEDKKKNSKNTNENVTTIKIFAAVWNKQRVNYKLQNYSMIYRIKAKTINLTKLRNTQKAIS